MNSERIIEAMGHIDPALVESADRKASRERRSRRGWSIGGVIAACLCLLLAGTAVAAEMAGVHVVGIFDSKLTVSPDGTEELVAGYTVSRGVKYFSVEDLSQKVVELNRTIQEPTAKSFSSWERMEEYLGIQVLDNPVLANAHAGGGFDVGVPGGQGRCVVYFDSGPGHKADGVTPMTGITRIELMGGYYLHYNDPDLQPWQGVYVSVSAELLLSTENNIQDEMSLLYEEDVSFTYEEYITTNGLHTLLFKAEVPEREGGSVPSPAVDWYEAEFTLNGVFFQVSAVDYKDFNGGNIPSGLVEETLKEVLDGFVYDPAA